MDPELGVLLALLLRSSPGFEETYQRLIHDLVQSKCLPRRIGWTGEEENYDISDLNKLCDQLPCDFLKQIVSHFQRTNLGSSSEFKATSLLDLAKYNYLTGDNREARLTKVSEGVVRRALGLSHPAFCIYFDQSESRLISAGDDGLIRIWCLKSGFLVSSVRGHSMCICDLSIDPKNRYLASCSLDQTIRIWDLKSGAPIILIDVGSQVLTVEFHQESFEDGRTGLLMATGQDGYLRLWTVDVRRRTVSDPPVKYYYKTLARDSIRMASFSPSGTRIVTGSTDGILRLLKTPSKEEVARGSPLATLQPYIYYLEDHEGYVNCLHYASDGKSLLTGSWDGTVRLWTFNANVNSWTSESYSTELIAPITSRRGRKITMVSFANSDQLIVTAVNELFAIVVFDKKMKSILFDIRWHTQDIQILSCHPTNDRILLSASYDGSVAIWDIPTGTRLFEYRTNCRFLDGSFSPSGDYFALTDDLGRISLFGLGISPDSFSMAPDVQLLMSDWLEPIFDEQRIPIDPLAQRPSHLVHPQLTCGLERNPNPIKTSASFFEEVIPDDWIGSLGQQKQDHNQKELKSNEIDLFNKELSCCPPGITPKHSRSRKKRIIYGSDVEELEEGPIFIEQDAVFSDVEVSRNLINDDHSTPTARRDRTTPMIPINPELDGDEEDLYNPSFERRTRNRRNTSRSSNRTSHGRQVPEPPEWLTIDDRRYSPYLPQMYDIVAYFPEGHRTFLDKEDRPEFHENLPPFLSTSMNRRTFKSPILGQIVDISFYAMERPWCQLAIVPLKDESIIEAQECIVDRDSDEKFFVSYYDMHDIPDFIILACRYQWALQQDFKIGQEVNVLYGHEEVYPGRITRVGSRRRSPWQCYTVQWLNLDDPEEDCSPWELESLEEDYENYTCKESIPEQILRTLIDGVRGIMQNRRAEFLLFPVDYAQFPDYLQVVPYPMCLDLILTRLQNGFYRRLESFNWDCQLVGSNTIVYNEPDSDIVKDSNYVNQLVEALLRRAQRPPRHAAALIPTSPIFQEDPTPRTASRKRARVPDTSSSEEDIEEEEDTEDEDMASTSNHRRRRSARSRESTSHPFRHSSSTSSSGGDGDRLVVYTDGSCINNGRSNASAGYGVYIPESSTRHGKRISGGPQTNQRAELEAVREAIKISSRDHRDIEIRTDSHYAIKGLTEWSKNWARDNWEKPIVNKDLFQDIIGMAQKQGKTYYMDYVPGHSGDHGNETANQLAQDAARRIH